MRESLYQAARLWFWRQDHHFIAETEQECCTRIPDNRLDHGRSVEHIATLTGYEALRLTKAIAALKKMADHVITTQHPMTFVDPCIRTRTDSVEKTLQRLSAAEYFPSGVALARKLYYEMGYAEGKQGFDFDALKDMPVDYKAGYRAGFLEAERRARDGEVR